MSSFVTSNKKLNLLQSTTLVTGNLVGSGVFMLPALLGVYGAASILGWVLTSIGAVFLALVFAKLGSFITEESGGPHSFVVKAYGDEAGFWVAWCYWMLSWASNTALVVAAVSYFSIMVGGLSTGWVLSLEILLWVLITGINLKGIKTAGRFEAVITILKLVPLIIIPLIALFFIKLDNFTPFLPTESLNLATALKGAIFLSIWAFIGVESATVPAKEVDNPSVTIPRATILGTLIAAGVYILGTFSAVGVLGSVDLANSSAPYADLADKIFSSMLIGNFGTVVVAATAFISCVGTFNGWTLIVARIAQGAADQKLFPKIFSKVNQDGTPIHSIIISSCCTLPIIIFTMQDNMLEQFNNIIDLAVTLILLVYISCIISYFKLLKQKDLMSIALGVGALIFAVFAVYASGLKTLGVSLLFLLTGLPFRYKMLRG